MTGSGATDRPQRNVWLAIMSCSLGVCFVAAAGTLFRPAFAISDMPGLSVSKQPERVADSTAVSIERQAGSSEPPTSRAVDSASAVPSNGEVARLMARGQALVAVGDFASARLVLRRAADTGSPDAVFALAATYDPNVLAARGARGLLGEPEQAKALYARALAAGLQDARSRMEALGG